MAYSLDSSASDCYTDTSVLINKLDLRTQDSLDEAERVAVTLRTVEIENAKDFEPCTFLSYCKLHEYLFSDIYDWAGKLRTVNLAKKGTNFCPAEQLASLGEAIFKRLQENGEFRDLPKDEYIREIAELYHDLNMLHPFREGNGRTQRLFFVKLLQRAGYQVDFSKCDTDALMMATIYAAQGVMDYLVDFWSDVLKQQ